MPTGNVGGTVFKLLRYIQDMMLMIPTDFCADSSTGLKDMAIYDKCQNGQQAVQSVLAQLT